MTLILGMSKPEGIYLSVDQRLTVEGEPEPTDDQAVKFLNVKYPPLRTGPQALFAYAGASLVRGRKPMDEWLRRTIEHGPHDFNGSMRNLFRRVHLDAYHRYDLVINGLVMNQGIRYFVGISNMKPRGGRTFEFDRTVEKIESNRVFGTGGAAPWAITQGAQFLTEQLDVVPQDAWSHMGLLARTNRRVAELDDRVSPHCFVSFVNAFDNDHPRAGSFLKGGEPGLLVVPGLRVGLEINSAAEHFNRTIETWSKKPSVFDPRQMLINVMKSSGGSRPHD